MPKSVPDSQHTHTHTHTHTHIIYYHNIDNIIKYALALIPKSMPPRTLEVPSKPPRYE